MTGTNRVSTRVRAAAQEMAPSSSSAVVIGLDLGTSSFKGAAYKLDGTLVRSCVRPVITSRPHVGWAEQDPENWWQELLIILRALGPASAIAIAGQANGLVLADGDGRALRPAIIWEDARTTAYGGPTELTSAVSRYEWLQDHEPDALRAAQSWLLPKDYLNLRLAGSMAADAATSVGLTQGGAYRDDLPKGLRNLLAPLRAESDLVGDFQGAMVAVGCMDSLAGMYGAAPLSAGLSFDVSGTSETIGLISVQAEHSSAVRRVHPLGSGLYLHAGPTQAGGDAAIWAQEAFCGERDLGRLFEEVHLSDQGASGIIFLPYLAGERAPLWDSSARGVFFGLSREHRVGDLFRAVLEGVAFSVRHVLESIEKATPERAARVVCSGGGAVDSTWSQIKADVIGRPIVQAAAEQAGTLGAAMVAACGLGAFESLQQASAAMVRPGFVLEPTPNKTNRAAYDDLFGLYCSLATSLRHEWEELNAIAQRRRSDPSFT
jgi:xylulokinase